MVFVVLITLVLHRMRASLVAAASHGIQAHDSGRRFVLVFTIPMVRILINSGVNERSGIDAGSDGGLIADSLGRHIPLFASSIGALRGLHRRLQHGLQSDAGPISSSTWQTARALGAP